MGIFDPLQDLFGKATESLPIDEITGAVEDATGAVEEVTGAAGDQAQGVVDDITQNLGL
jgi:uncharacterized protein YjbJ (UPF0337 family)